MNDWMFGHPGGIKRVTGDVQGAAMPVPTQPISHRILPALDYFDQRKEVRTGVGRATAGLDADVLKQSTASAYSEAQNKSDEIIETIARVFAETGVKDLFRGIHELLVKHQDKQRMLKINGEWSQMNPASWRGRYDMTVNVGLGNTSGQEHLQNLNMIASAQERAFAAGVVQPVNVYNLAEDMVDKAGVMKKDRYFTHPDKMPQQESDPMKENPLALPEVIKMQSRQQADQAKYQHDMKKTLFEAMKSENEQERELAFRVMELEVNSGIDLLNAGIGAEMEAEKLGQSKAAALSKPNPQGGGGPPNTQQ
jgi:hypothetical protein